MCVLSVGDKKIIQVPVPVPAPPGKVIVFVQSDESPNARMTAARLNDTKVPVDADGKAELTAFHKGANQLDITVEGVEKAGDDIQLVEDCGNGETLVVATKFAGTGPGGPSPEVSFDIQGI